MGKLVWLIVLLISHHANAGLGDSDKFSDDIYREHKKTLGERLNLTGSSAKVDFERQIIVVTTTLIQKDKPKVDYMFGGNFSPTATAYLRPIRNSRLKAFVQVRCDDYFCKNLVVGIGIRTSVSNPYAYNEQRFVLLSDGRYEQFIAERGM